MKKPKPKKYEGSRADMAADKKNAKKAGMSMKRYESSAADKREDAKGQRAMNRKRK